MLQEPLAASELNTVLLHQVKNIIEHARCSRTILVYIKPSTASIIIGMLERWAVYQFPSKTAAKKMKKERGHHEVG